MIIKGVIQDDAFYCDHLGANNNDERDIMNFTVGHPDGKGLENYLRYLSYEIKKRKWFFYTSIQTVRTTNINKMDYRK